MAPRQSSPEAGLATRECPSCGITFQPYRDFQRACSRKCRDVLGPANDAPHAKLVEFTCQSCGRTSHRRSTVGAGQFKFCTDCKPEAERRKNDRKNASRRMATTKDPELRRLLNRAAALSRYGLTQDEFDAMFAAQHGLCAICKNPPAATGWRTMTSLHIDHDHITGTVRDLLCGRCNQGIGSLRDDPDLLRAAADYIERHR